MESKQDVLGVAFTPSNDMIVAYIVEHKFNEGDQPLDDYCTLYIGTHFPKIESGFKVEKFKPFFSCVIARKEDALYYWSGRIKKERKGD